MKIKNIELIKKHHQKRIILGHYYIKIQNINLFLHFEYYKSYFKKDFNLENILII